MNKDLGLTTCAYAEDEILATLGEEKLVCYEVVELSDGGAHIGLSLGLIRARKGFGLNWDMEYGGMGRSLTGPR